ncbi:MAG TPA: TolC family outer membrane protein [Coxiellaceae bacterium]|nr:TolC family outer membrane protein [Coxiellaceae bacterium]
MKRYWQVLSVLMTGFFLSSVYADNLIQIYNQALIKDPIFEQAQSTWEAQKMNLPIAEAGYLPQISISADSTRDYTHVDPNITSYAGSYSWEYGYTLTATQTVFNFAVWAQIENASDAVKAATATYLAAQQSLMQRTVSAYFAVLQAYDILRYTVANKRAVWQQYISSEEQFKVGLIAITDEYDARSRYDQVVAQQIIAQNNLNTTLEELRQLTGHSYRALSGIGKLPMITPQPSNIDTWVKIADRQNYSIQAQNYTVQAAMETIKQQAAAGYPSLGLQGVVGETHKNSNPPDTATDNQSLGLVLSYNPIQGGAVDASTKQAQYNYVTAAGLLEQTHRQVVEQARTSFLSVLSNISQIQADKQSILSAQNALTATEAGLKVGTRTMVDVLSALTTLYQAQKLLAVDQYTYINNLVALKLAAGTLSLSDIQAINAWLGKSIVFPNQVQSAAAMPTEDDHGVIDVSGDERTHILVKETPVASDQTEKPAEKQLKKSVAKPKPVAKKEKEIKKSTEAQLPEPKKTLYPEKTPADKVIDMYKPTPKAVSVLPKPEN